MWHNCEITSQQTRWLAFVFFAKLVLPTKWLQPPGASFTKGHTTILTHTYGLSSEPFIHICRLLHLYLCTVKTACLALPNKELYFQPKCIDVFLISPQTQMLWVHIRSALIYENVLWVVIRSSSVVCCWALKCFHGWIRKKHFSGYTLWPPLTPFLYSKTGVYRNIHYISYFSLKT